MKKSIRILLALTLALTMLLGLQTAALAADPTALICQTGRTDSDVSLTLSGLDGGIYGIQVEMTLQGQYPQCTFTHTIASDTAYSPDCTVSVTGQETRVTIYLTDANPLNSGSSVELGTLRLGAPAAGRGVLPETAQVKLLNHGLSTAVDGSVPVTDRTEGGDTPQPSYPSGPSTPGNPVTPVTPTTPGTPGQSTQTPEDEDNSVQTPEGTDPGSVVLPFSDVGERDWFYEAVRYVYAKGMMGGTGSGTFSPGATTTRGMIVTILHRLEGTPTAAGTAFSDVAPGQYYAGAVAWASSVGVVNGYGDGTFQPDAPITREQMAAILFRYAQQKGIDVSRRASLDQFADNGKVSAYAVDAMAWAVDAGLIAGMDGQLNPTGSATRAQVATILMRLCEKVL